MSSLSLIDMELGSATNSSSSNALPSYITSVKVPYDHMKKSPPSYKNVVEHTSVTESECEHESERESEHESECESKRERRREVNGTFLITVLSGGICTLLFILLTAAVSAMLTGKPRKPSELYCGCGYCDPITTTLPRCSTLVNLTAGTQCCVFNSPKCCDRRGRRCDEYVNDRLCIVTEDIPSNDPDGKHKKNGNKVMIVAAIIFAGFVCISSIIYGIRLFILYQHE